TGYFYKGMYEKAVSLYQKAERGLGGQPSAKVARVHAQAGKTNAALKILRRLIQKPNRTNNNARLIALLFLTLGEKQKALDWLERAYRARDPYLVFLNVHPGFATLRLEPRFQDLLRRMYFPL
ncbi:MAG: tetratricopeptide repeat protein, partial [Deltaproteobacteria bacterium]